MSGLQIIVEPLKLSAEQRRAVAALILNPSISEEEMEDNPNPQPHEVFVAEPVVIPPAPVAAPAKVVTMPAAVPAPSAPVEVAAPPAPAAVSSELDSAGLPWDARIHSVNKTKSENGRWRVKRGLGDGEQAIIEAELKALMGTPVVAVPPAPVPVPPAPAPVAVPAPPAPVAAPAEVGATREGYVALITKASAAIGGKKIVKEELDAVCATLGVSSLPLLANRLDLVPQVTAALDALLATK